jgi:hypothetical protein
MVVPCSSTRLGREACSVDTGGPIFCDCAAVVSSVPIYCFTDERAIESIGGLMTPAGHFFSSINVFRSVHIEGSVVNTYAIPSDDGISWWLLMPPFSLRLRKGLRLTFFSTRAHLRDTIPIQSDLPKSCVCRDDPSTDYWCIAMQPLCPSKKCSGMVERGKKTCSTS